MDPEGKAQEVFERGYCVLESVYSEEECEDMRRIMHDGWVRAGKPKMDGLTGANLHPSLQHVPDLARYYGRQEVIDVLAATLKDDVRLEYGGANIADETRSFFHWHVHENGLDGIDKETLMNPDRDDHYDSVVRINCNVYPDGSNADLGELLAYPRQLSDPLAPPYPDVYTEWEGQVVVTMPPGSVLVSDQVIWHAARPPSKPTRRHLFGAFYVGWNGPTSKKQDPSQSNPALEPLKRKYPVFRRLIERPAAS